MFDVQAVLDGAWDDTAFYRRGDQRGTLQEVTPTKTREALNMLDGCRPVVTYNLGEPIFNGFPAFPSAPPRLYDQCLLILGYDPPPGYDGILQSPTPLGANRISAHEERLGANSTYQLGTQLDNRPVIVGADNWALEVAGNPVAGSNIFPVHQELITHHGIRIGEAIVSDRLAEDRVHEFVYIVTPQLALGATAGNAPPCALGQPR